MIIKNDNWAFTLNNSPITLYKSAPHTWDSQKQPLLFIGGVHGDEPEGVRLAEELLNWLDENSSQYPNAPWLLITCLNPDGYALNQRVNANGVDLNRNYPSKCWSPDFSKDRYFPGAAPGSEPEIKAILDLITEYNPKVILHFHSWEPCVVYAGDIAKKYAQFLSASSGYQLKEDIGYPTPGSLSEFGWKDNSIPIICVEEQEGTNLDEVWQNFAHGLENIIKDFNEEA